MLLRTDIYPLMAAFDSIGTQPCPYSMLESAYGTVAYKSRARSIRSNPPLNQSANLADDDYLAHQAYWAYRLPRIRTLE